MSGMTGVAIGVGVASTAATVYSANKASGAADAQAQGQQNAINAQQSQYEQTRQDQQPYRTTGNSALNMLAKSEGLDYYDPYKSTGGGTYNVPNTPFGGGGSYTTPGQTGGVVRGSGHGDNSGFFASPDYGFRRSEGMRGVQQSAAARGGAFSGNALKALTEYNSNLASGEYGNWFNRIGRIAGIGQDATNAVGQFGQQSANNISQGYANQGDARASGLLGQGNSITGGLNSGIQNYMGLRNQYNQQNQADWNYLNTPIDTSYARRY